MLQKKFVILLLFSIGIFLAFFIINQNLNLTHKPTRVKASEQQSTNQSSPNNDSNPSTSNLKSSTPENHTTARQNSQEANTGVPEQTEPPTEQQTPMIGEKRLSTILREKGITSYSGLSIYVNKSAHTLSILNNGTWLKTYRAEFGDGGSGDKESAGDHKTPEGTFYVTQKSVLNPEDEYLGTRWMRLSYPNIEDASRGLNRELIDPWTYDEIVTAINSGSTPPQYTELGGGVGIHGGDKPSFGSNWTWGCVGLSNKDVEDFYDFIAIGTKVSIES